MYGYQIRIILKWLKKKRKQIVNLKNKIENKTRHWQFEKKNWKQFWPQKVLIKNEKKSKLKRNIENWKKWLQIIKRKFYLRLLQDETIMFKCIINFIFLFLPPVLSFQFQFSFQVLATELILFWRGGGALSSLATRSRFPIC